MKYLEQKCKKIKEESEIPLVIVNNRCTLFDEDQLGFGLLSTQPHH